MTYSLDLMFREPSKDDLSGPSIAQIYIKRYTSDEQGHIFITPNCVSMREIGAEIERLKQELETIKEQANQRFKKS